MLKKTCKIIVYELKNKILNTLKQTKSSHCYGTDLYKNYYFLLYDMYIFQSFFNNYYSHFLKFENTFLREPISSLFN